MQLHVAECMKTDNKLGNPILCQKTLPHATWLLPANWYHQSSCLQSKTSTAEAEGREPPQQIQSTLTLDGCSSPQPVADHIKVTQAKIPHQIRLCRDLHSRAEELSVPEEHCRRKATPAYNWNNLFTTRAPQKQTYNVLKYRVINHQSTTQLSFKFLSFFSFKPCQPYSCIDAQHIRSAVLPRPAKCYDSPSAPASPLGLISQDAQHFPSVLRDFAHTVAITSPK